MKNHDFPLFDVALRAASTLKNYDFPLFDVALRAASTLKNHDFPLFDVALRAASILKNHALLYSFNILNVAKRFYLAGFEHREYVRTLSFEKCCRMH